MYKTALFIQVSKQCDQNISVNLVFFVFVF